jgi:choline dehydrogenase-like flavoprotein
MTFQEESMNWGYGTAPQDGCDGRILDYSRGKGLGGGSSINFGINTSGARDDHESWPEIVGDEGFGWEEMKKRFKNLETFGLGACCSEEGKRYGNPVVGDHGDEGALKVGFAKKWEMDLVPLMDSFEEAGLKRNLDHNSGDPLGMALYVHSAGDGVRSTAKDLLVDAPNNLVVVKDTPVQRILFEGKRAVGIQTRGTKCEYTLLTRIRYELTVGHRADTIQ